MPLELRENNMNLYCSTLIICNAIPHVFNFPHRMQITGTCKPQMCQQRCLLACLPSTFCGREQSQKQRREILVVVIILIVMMMMKRRIACLTLLFIQRDVAVSLDDSPFTNYQVSTVVVRHENRKRRPKDVSINCHLP